MVTVSEERFSDWKHVATSRLGASLRLIRKSRGMSQERVAIDAGISVPTYSQLERGITVSGADANPTLETLLRVIVVLDIQTPGLVPNELS